MLKFRNALAKVIKSESNILRIIESSIEKQRPTRSARSRVARNFFLIAFRSTILRYECNVWKRITCKEIMNNRVIPNRSATRFKRCLLSALFHFLYYTSLFHSRLHSFDFFYSIYFIRLPLQIDTAVAKSLTLFAFDRGAIKL